MATGWYYGVVRLLWPMWNPLARRQPYPSLLFGHLLFGLAMGGYPRFLAQFRKEPPPDPQPDAAGSEPRTEVEVLGTENEQSLEGAANERE